MRLNYNKICGHLFFVLWINFIICAILSGGLLIFRVASFLSWRIRHIQMTGEIRINPTTYPLVKKLTYPKFLVLMVVGENCHALLYDRLLEHLAAFEGVGANDIKENPENDKNTSQHTSRNKRPSTEVPREHLRTNQHYEQS